MNPTADNSSDAPADAPTDSPRVVVLGLGGAGLRTAAHLAARTDAAWLAIAGVDTDEPALRDSRLPNAFAVGSEWTQGQGCGGDPQRGARAMAHKSQKEVEQFIQDAALVFILGGMGGGVATGGITVLSRLARRLHVPAICLVTMPFSFEGHARREIAEEGIRQLLPDAEVVIPLPNDLLFARMSADTPAEAAFRAADDALAGAVLTLAEILRCRNLLAADFADFRSLLGKRKSACAIGCGESDRSEDGGDDHLQHLLENLMDSPLLGGPGQIAEADAMVAVLSGGADFSIGEMKQALEALQRMCRPECRIVAGAVHIPAPEGRRRLTVLTIRFDAAAAPLLDHDLHPAVPRPAIFKPAGGAAGGGELIQTEFSLFRLDRGIFISTTPNIHEGVDLDVPTFQRQEITLDKGK